MSFLFAQSPRKHAGEWEACQFPERRPDQNTVFPVACRSCQVALRAAISIEPPLGAFDGWWRKRGKIAENLQHQDAEDHVA